MAAFDDYSAIPAMNWSSLKVMHESPRAFKRATKVKRKDTPAFARGRAIHCARLEPERYSTDYIVEPTWQHDGRTKDGKAERAAWRERAEGKEVISVDLAATVAHCVEAIAEHEEATRLLSGGLAEVTVEWLDVATGTKCKAREDYISKPRYVADLKTCTSLASFERDAARYLYHGQMAWYLDGATEAGLVEPGAGAYIVAVETTEPFDCAALPLPGMAIEAGRRLYRGLLDLHYQCSVTGLWPGRWPALHELNLPPWAPGMSEAQSEVWL